MACFLVPTAEAVVTTAVEKHIEKKEAALPEEERAAKAEFRIPFRTKLKWLNTMLIGGAVLLAFEHLWHGEIVPWFPFLSAMSNPADQAAMFGEMATVGVTMAVLVTAVWGVMCIIADAMLRKKEAPESI